MPLWGVLLSLLCAFMWAASPIMVDRGMERSGCTSNEINPIRSFSYLAVSFAVAFFCSGGSVPLVTSPEALFYIAVSVLLSYAVGDILYFISLRVLGVGIAVSIMNSYPMFVVLTAWAVLGETVSLMVFAGIAVVVAGLILLKMGVSSDASAAEKARMSGKTFAKGALLALGAGVCYALGSPTMKKGMELAQIDPTVLVFYRSAIFFVTTWIIRFVTVKMFPDKVMPISKVCRAGWAGLLGAGAVGLCAASILYAACIRSLPVAIVTAITATSPIFAALYGHFVIKQRLYPLQWLGVALIIVGTAVISV